jgi:hypothetical protein
VSRRCTRGTGADELRFRKGAFVRVMSMVKFGNNNRPTLSNVNVAFIKDGNELTMHFLETIAVHLDRSRRIPFSKGGSHYESMSSGAAAPSGSAPAAIVPSFGGIGFGGMGGGSLPGGMPSMPIGAAVTASSANGDANNLKQLIKAEISSCQNEDGAFIPDIARALQPKGFTEEQVRRAVEDLSMAGLVYSTVDDDHILTTED